MLLVTRGLVAHPTENIKSIRPNKVEFKSVSDTSSILSRANRLRHDDYFERVYINKWCSYEDMKSIQQLHSQCERLNNNHSPSVNGRKKFFVTSRKIKQRNASGQPHDYCIPNNSCAALNDAISPCTKHPKKVSVRGQVTP